MDQPLKKTLSGILDLPFISRIRRNHGLEHATLHQLASLLPRTMLAGHSDAGGFYIIGDVPSDTMQRAVQEAIARLRAGESSLAVHPNCGTNFATAGTLAGLGGALAMVGAGKNLRDKLNRLPFAAVLATLALIVAQPLGLLVQARVTTSGDPGTLEVTSITHQKKGRVMVYRIHTRG
ncbi:MAG: hypothetical protein A2136_07320 [Chloroflexi bacterium RBG_16_54_11]|nr:MAG: hypothetical protein A2136_07320 [Chloroflexi bacterium RBG_16_54_11]